MRHQTSASFSAQISTQDIRDNILTVLLPEIPFDGWAWGTVEAACVRSGYETAMAASVFPGGLSDVLDHFADMADRWMLERLKDTDTETMRVRDRVSMAVMARLRILYQYREALRQAGSYWMLPTHTARGGKIAWRTADRIWDWAGDNATDYNHYTKRALLCGVLVSTTLAWLDDDSTGMQETEAFLKRRIDNAMSIGKIAGKAKAFSFLKRNRKQDV